MKRKIVALISLALIVASICFTGKALISNAYEKFVYVVVLDAGHGGIDGGVVGVQTGVVESELNLKMVYELKDIYEKSGFKVVLTRTDENGLYGEASSGFKLRDLKKRRDIINNSNADMVISIHMNKYSASSRRGAQVFFKIDDKKSNFLAEKIQFRLNLMKESPRISNALKGDYYILNTAKIPAVIVECGFLSNKDDEKLLQNEEYRKKLAKEIYNGSIDYLISVNDGEVL